MPQYSFNDLGWLRLQPIFRLWLIDEDAPDGWTIEDEPSTLVTATAISLALTEAESNMTVTPITRRTMYGGDRQVGQLLTITHYTSIADMVDFHNLMSNFVGKRVSGKVQFGGYRGSGNFTPFPQPEIPGYQQRFLYLTKFSYWDARCEVSYRVEPAEQRLRTVITVQARLPAGTGLASLWTDNDTWYW